MGHWFAENTKIAPIMLINVCAQAWFIKADHLHICILEMQICHIIDLIGENHDLLHVLYRLRSVFVSLATT